METTRFDAIATTLAETSTRRGALRFLAAAALGAGSLALLGQDEGEARRRRPGRRRPHHPHYPHADSRPLKTLRQICSPASDICSGSLECGAPTTRHTCSDTVASVASWCCVPARAVCSGECDCCGNTYCSYDDNNVGHCVPNPEG
jgi:hypothetical protein